MSAHSTIGRRLPSLPSVGDLMKIYRVHAVKRLSQNFLMHAGWCRRIALAGGSVQDAHVCEVGPGPGNLTRPLLQQSPRSLTVIERDTRFLPGLIHLRDCMNAATSADSRSSHTAMHIVAGDILSYDVDRAFSHLPARDWLDPVRDAVIVGNLPFNISTPLLIRWLRQIAERDSVWQHARIPMVLTFQHEVAQRLAAPVGTRQRCRLSVMAQCVCHVHHCFTVPARVFVPRPEVDVGVVVLRPLQQPFIDFREQPFSRLEKVARCLFNVRAKHLVKAVGNLYPAKYRNQLAADTMRLADLDPRSSDLRPVNISVEEVVRIVEAYSQICQLHEDLEFYDFTNEQQTALKWENDPNMRDIVK